MLSALRNRSRRLLESVISSGRQAAAAARRDVPVVWCEPVERRTMLAVTASYSAATLTLSVVGDTLDNTITLSRNAAGNILVNGGAVGISGGVPTVANTGKILVVAGDGNDTVTFNEASGALPAGDIQGGNGADSLTGGSGSDSITGGAGNDTLLGKGGFDTLFGGADNDVLTGGDADDQVSGDAGNDRMIWNPGDDTDVNEGGTETDTVEVNGGGGAEVFTTTANSLRVRFDRLDPAPFSIDIGTTENLVLNMNGGNDSTSATGNLAALISITADGGAGNDTILGSNGIDLLIGGDGDDFVDGQQGNDTAFLGAGNDVFQWDPGDGSDVVEGQADSDRLLFNGSAGSEIFTTSANGGRVTFTRNLGTITMDLGDVETIDLNALAGTDSVVVNDLSGTDLTEINVNLSGVIGGATGDAAVDSVFVNGTNGNDVIDVVGAGTSFSVLGLPLRVNVTASEGANDTLAVNALGGNDSITATTVPAGVVKLTADGGAGDDVLLGSQGADVLLGGDNNDFLFGDNGNDTAFMGAGNDVFQWDPGDGNDQIEGQDGSDTMLFFGANVSENITVSPNGGRVIFFRDVASVTMDLDDVEQIDYRALGGADNIVIGDMTGTDLTQVLLDLRGPNGGGDAAADSVTVNGTQAADVFGAGASAGVVTVFGLQAQVVVSNAELANDRLTLNGLGGDDNINATTLGSAAMQLTMNGGLGADVMIGSGGGDLMNGGDGNDTAFMGAGDDTFVWNPGDDNDVVEGQAGVDTLLFNGANVAENISAFANGGRVTFFRDIASVTMDLDDTESITYNALGGADTITVNDLSGTDVRTVRLNLAASGGAGDLAVDTVNIAGSSGDDVITQVLASGALVTSGLTATVSVEGFEATDAVRVNAQAGDDVVDGSGTAAGGPLIAFDGGFGDDILLGGAGAETLLGGDGDDVLLGDGFLDGGVGSNITITRGAGPSAGVVSVFGDALDNQFTITRDAVGQIFANGVPVPGATVANTALIRVFGREGNDTLTINEASGALPAVALYGGAGADAITGGSGNDLIFGGRGNDALLGRGGFDLLFGGADNDTLTGGDADDQVFGEAGSDRMIWNPGDDTDLNEGDVGSDTVEVNGGGGAEVFTTTANGTRVRFDRLDPAPFSIDIGTSESLVLNMNGGDDSCSATGNLAALIQITFDGGTGNDTILGSNGIDLLLGGDGDDFVDGQQGNDTAFLGAGNDVFQWDPGDGSDVVEGQANSDRLLFNGSAGSEIFTATANGGRVTFTRNLGTITMDLDDVETIDLNALGGIDSVVVNNLSGTDLAVLNVNLAGTIGGTIGDAAVDSVTLNGTNAANVVDVFGSGANYAVVGLPVQVNVNTSEGANDSLGINVLGGNDSVTATTLPAGVVQVSIDGGADNDSLLGSQGIDVLLGGDGDDFLFGDNGNDTAFMGAGNDVFQWDPGDGNDVVEGQAGSDTLLFNGSSASEVIDVVPNGARLRLARNVGGVVMDADDVETVRLNTIGGVDVVNAENLGVTDVAQVILDLDVSTGAGAGDDTVNVNAAGVGTANLVFDSTQRTSVLNIGSGGTARLTPNGEKVLITAQLNLAGTGRLDLSNNSAIIDYAPGGSVAVQTRARLASGFAAGAWNGVGIISSAAAANPATRIGFAEATDLFTVFPATFKGQGVDATAILLTHTLAGDANLDGQVGLADFSLVGANFNTANRRWSQGDFDYNGNTTLADFSTLASNYGLSEARTPTFSSEPVRDDVLRSTIE